MTHKILALTIVLCVSLGHNAKAQYSVAEVESKRYFIGSSLFTILNVIPNERPDFAQINIGYRLSPKDALSVEIKTWRYFEPIGIPYGPQKVDPAENFPGYIREKGFALAYQRFLWKGLYTGIHVMNAWQSFIGTNGNKVDDGFQIFNTYRLGYHFRLLGGSFFIEPSIAVTHRPYHTQMPESFKAKDDKWSKFFYGEPGLHFGFNF